MHNCLFIVLRQGRAAIIKWIITALMLPALLSALPSPASAAERDAYALIAQSYCDPLGSTKGEQNKPDHGGEACIVCAVGCAVSQPAAVAKPVVALALKHIVPAQPVDLTHAQSPVSAPALIRPGPPRGPPLLTV